LAAPSKADQQAVVDVNSSQSSQPASALRSRRCLPSHEPTRKSKSPGSPVDHILGLTDTGERFTREDGFDLTAFWASGVAGFRAGLWQGEAIIRLSPAGRERTAEMSAIQATASPTGDDGWVTAVVPIESLIHAHQDFLRLGAEVEVLEPAGLRERLAETARSLAAIYGGVRGT